MWSTGRWRGPRPGSSKAGHSSIGSCEGWGSAPQISRSPFVVRAPKHVRQVEQADLYPSGAIVVELRPEAHGASLSDIDRLERKLDQLRASVERLAQTGS